MFDAPDLGPLCLAPWIGLGTAVLVFVVVAITTKRYRRGRWVIPIAVGLLVFPIVTCGSFSLRIGELDPTPWVMPTTKDVVGTWHLDAHFAGILNDQGYVVPPHSIEFKEDGTFEMRNVPNLWITLSDADPEVQTEFDAKGTWTIGDRNSIYTSSDPNYVVFLRYEYLSLDNIDLKETPVYIDGQIPIFFRGHIPPYRLDAIGYDTYNPFMRFVRE